MRQFVLYNIEVATIMLCFYLVYILIYKNSKDFKFSRFYIVSSTLLSILIPFMPIINFNQTTIFQGILDTVTIGSNTMEQSSNINGQAMFNYTDLILSAYGIIVILMTLILLKNIINILKLIRSTEIGYYKNFKIVKEKSILAPYSFFKYIFLPTTIDYNNTELDIVLEHESMHGKLGHSFDKVILLLVKCFFWWNPICYYYIKELSLIHEYEVDESIAKKHSKKEYGEFLLQQLLNNNKYNFVNPISSQIKERLIMLNSNSTPMKFTKKWLVFAGVLCIAIVFHACQSETVDGEINNNVKQESSTKKSYELNTSDTIAVFDNETKEEEIRIVQSQQTVFLKPDQMPRFPGCEEISSEEEKSDCAQKNLLEYIYTNIKYSEDARNNGIEGMVVVKFVVDKIGRITNENIVRKLGYGLDKEVLKMIDQFRKDNIRWIPGKVNGESVSVEYTLPVKFKLE